MLSKINILKDEKKFELATRFFTYGVMALTTTVLTILAIFYALGYRFNQEDQNFQQGGLLQFHAFPDGATVIVDGAVKNFKTPGRLNTQTGKHDVKMELAGYRAWSKTVDVLPGQLTWLNYTRFVPETITIANIKEFDSLTDNMVSPDRRFNLLQEKPNQPKFVLADLTNNTKPIFKTLTIPDDKLTKKNNKYGTFKIVEWGLGSRYVLISHTIDKTKHFLRLDTTRPNEIINLNTASGLNISEAHFAGSNPNLMFVNSGGVLRKLDLSNNSTSPALVNGIEFYQVYGGNDEIAFIAKRKLEGSSADSKVVGIWKNGQETIVRTLSSKIDLKIAFTEYFKKMYIAINAGGSVVDILPSSSVGGDNVEPIKSIDLGQVPGWIKFSNNGRMLIVGDNDDFINYDLETGLSSKGDLKSTDVAGLDWLDDFHLISDSNNRLYMEEFDGANGRDISGVAQGFDVGLSNDEKFIYLINKSQSGKFVLQSVKMIVD